MTDNKEYIIQAQDNGNVLISEDVIAAITAQAILDVEGVVGLTSKASVDIAEMIGVKTPNKGIKISITPENTLEIFCNISVAYGQNVLTVAKNVQNSVTNAVESMTGISVVSTQVNISGIGR